LRIIDTYQDIRLKTSIRKISPKIYNCLLLKQKKLVALMEQNSNQIMMDMKNIYNFKDIFDLPLYCSPFVKLDFSWNY
jgi:hypothetical protein